MNTEITYFACGGTGINLAIELKKGSKTQANKDARIVGLDSSTRNDAANLFPVERIEGALGSGKNKMANFEAAIPFVNAVIAKYRPTAYNVVLANTAGGTGSMLAVLIARELVKAGHIVALCLVSDHTSLIEKENSVGGLRSFANQTLPGQLNAPMCYMEYINEENKTRGEVNEEIIGGLNLLSMLFTADNTEMDYEDVKRVFNYSANGKAHPALSRISFYDQNSAKEFDGKPPVAVASLYKTSDEITPTFVGSMYRTTGVFAQDINLPKDLTQLHMTLDHGEALQALEKEIEVVDADKAKAAVAYSRQKDLSQGANDFGMIM